MAEHIQLWPFRLLPQGDSFRTEQNYFEGLNVRGLHPDERDPDLLWVCSSNGLFALNIKTGTYSVLGEADGMRNSYVYGVLEDEKHNLWLSTNGGLSYYNRTTGKFTNYTVAEGLQSNEFNSGAHHKGRSGRLYFGGISGFNWFLPQQVQETGRGTPPGVALLGVMANEKALPLNLNALDDGGLYLPYYQNNLAFSFAALDFTRPGANRISYMLDGWDATWITTSARSAHYSNLSPGTYMLRLKAVNGDGVWSAEQRIPIHIAAPFWKTTLFYTCVAIMALCLLIGLVVIIIRRRVAARMRVFERQRALMEERSRISRDMHDEIGSGLTRIAMLSEGLKLQGQPIGTNDPQKISLAARGLVQNMSEIIWALNPTQDTLEGLLAYVREQVSGFVESIDINCTISFPDEVPAVSLSNVQRRNIYLTVKEAVNNALKHSGASQLSVSGRIIDESLQIDIRDNGRGFAAGEVRHAANGLRNMKRRIEEVGGGFSCDTGAKGTGISITIPFTIPATNVGSPRVTTFFTLRRQKQS